MRRCLHHDDDERCADCDRSLRSCTTTVHIEASVPDPAAAETKPSLPPADDTPWDRPALGAYLAMPAPASRSDGEGEA